MRPIKFRGKHKTTEEWVYGDLEHLPNNNIHIFGDHASQPVIAESIGQFTGLIDHNGKEIYEGDFLECPQVRTIPLEVYYNSSKGAFCLAEHTHTEGILKGTTPIGDMFMYYPEMFIIGNIYDNPEILKSA